MLGTELPHIAVRVVFCGKNRKFSALPSCNCGRLFSSARQAAFWPALSPSKQKYTWSAWRISLRTCSPVVAVPSVATA
jgi:hypothetical protein